MPNNVRRRYYQITGKGQKALVDRLTGWQRFCNAMKLIMLPGAQPETE